MKLVTVYIWGVSMPRILLGLLEEHPRHGYDLKRLYDDLFSQDRPINAGQVYAALSRMEGDGRVAIEGTEPGNGPDRTLYVITEHGVTDLAQWLHEPEPPQPGRQNVMFAKVVLALLSDRSPEDFLDRQRAAHLQRMRELTRLKRDGGLTDGLLADHALFHLEADLRWIEVTGHRLAPLRRELR